MKTAIRIFSYSLAIVIIACNKGNDPAPTPPQPPPPPVVKDSLLGDWQKINAGFDRIEDVAFTDPKNGFICNHLGIYSSQDSGKTWTQTSTGYYVNLYFFSPQIGYALGFPDFAYTLDGGKSWIKKSLSSTNIGPTPYNFCFVSTSTGFVTGPGGLYKTTDTGNTWQLKYSQPTNGIYFRDANNGWVESLPLIKTQNGGNSWQQLTRPNSDLNFHYNTLQFTDDAHGWLSTATIINRTVDSGKTWVKTDFSPAHVGDVHFVNNTIGYLCTETAILKTVDGGVTWTQNCKVNGAYIVEIWFLDEHTGWASGSDGTFLRLRN